MKRFISLLICTFLVCSIGLARKDDAHLLKMVQCINDSDFNCAQNELSQIKKWKNTTLALSIGNAISFYNDIVNNKETRAIKDHNLQLKLASFIAKEAKEHADYKEDEYETAISYGEITPDFYKNAAMLQSIEFANAIGNIGVYYDNMKEYSNAEAYYLYSIHLYEEIGEVCNLYYARYLSYLADIYSKKGNVSGEGVFGLQRAFKLAGAQTIIMSIWRVHDDATRMLMTAFYRHYGSMHNKRDAFHAAQQEVRTKYKNPYFWAGFIMLD